MIVEYFYYSAPAVIARAPSVSAVVLTYVYVRTTMYRSSRVWQAAVSHFVCSSPYNADNDDDIICQ